MSGPLLCVCSAAFLECDPETRVPVFDNTWGLSDLLLWL
ncbi:hypothetical protein JL2886_00254 [Phaeobacter gallaeciensis]|uniref:Uncharacterized protein n=1 Tax=Phaeobacter gallaeciensis TaxID=60890 RepID=A0A1B0ZM15_9RHOB|nr:hypothetical protein JL2886_00254 [Phaeobacter gallaeciensis]